MFRVGFGQDSHRFTDDEKKMLVLGGVEIPGEAGLLGNSDADVVIHALCRALEQALGRESFSIYADKMHEQVVDSSREYLKMAKSHVRESGYKIGNIGISIEAKKPKIIPIAEDIKKCLAGILDIDHGSVGISATSGEELTSFGRGEGIQAFAIVSLIKE